MKQLPTRQRIRKALIILSFLLFPITIFYLSPVLVIESAAQGIVNGSLILFGLMFVSSLFVGRLWCGWACPGAGLQEIVEPVNNRRVNGRKIDWIKWLIWVPWIALIAITVVRAGGYSAVDFLFGTEGGISVAATADRPIIFAYIVYYAVIALFVGLAIAVGRRAGCHTICWMAPFMILGRWIRNLVAWPSLRLKADADACTNCKRCTNQCPMSLDVNAMVQAQAMENTECVLCGNCVDTCPTKAIRYSFSAGK